MSKYLKYRWRSVRLSVAALLLWSALPVVAANHPVASASTPAADVATLAGHYVVDRARSNLTFSVSRILAGKVRGQFDSFSGEFDIPRQSLAKTRLKVAIQTASVDTGNKLIDSIVAGQDFFSVKQHPEISFRSTEVRLTGPTTAELSGYLTLRGVTRLVTFAVTYHFDPIKPRTNEVRVAFKGKLQISRSAFGMDGLPGLVGDKVYIALNAQAYSLRPGNGLAANDPVAD